MNKINKLRKAAKEVKYEIQMFEDIHNNYFNKANSIKSQFEQNILLESFVIHAYCLFHFFYQGDNKKRKPSDIIAEDFNINRQQFRKHRTPKNVLKNIDKKRNKQIAHLTYNRIYRNSKTKPFKTTAIYHGINKTMWAFFNSLPKEYKNYFD